MFSAVSGRYTARRSRHGTAVTDSDLLRNTLFSTLKSEDVRSAQWVVHDIDFLYFEKRVDISSELPCSEPSIWEQHQYLDGYGWGSHLHLSHCDLCGALPLATTPWRNDIIGTYGYIRDASTASHSELRSKCPWARLTLKWGISWESLMLCCTFLSFYAQNSLTEE